MTLLLRPAQNLEETDGFMDESAWPPEVELILSALDTAAQLRMSQGGASDKKRDQRRSARRPHRVQAELHLFCDTFDHAPWIIYTRDTTATHIGFISDRCIPLGKAGKVRWRDARGKLRTATCAVSRCRETVTGWFEGALALHPD